MTTPDNGRCPYCDYPLPNPWTNECHHRRACEARQMLHRGEPIDKAAAHAQRWEAIYREGELNRSVWDGRKRS